MRWYFPQYQNASELDWRQSRLQAIDAWWRAFADHAKRISDAWDTPGSPPVDLPAFMSQTLQQIDSRLMWEFGPAVKSKGHRLVITPEADHVLRPMVDTLLKRAPTLEGWEFYGARLSESLADAESTVQGRTDGSLEHVMVRVETDQSHRINLTFLHPDFSGADDQSTRSVAFVGCESLLGERCLEQWIGSIECDRLDPAEDLRSDHDARGLIGLDRLCPTVEAVIGARRDQLPAQPLSDMGLHDESGTSAQNDVLGWATLSLEPPDWKDYPQRSDLFVAVTAWIECCQATFSRYPFYSESFSKHGEVFCYLKTDGREGFAQESWEDRSGLEDDLNAALKQADAGTVWGGGTGKIYSYVEFALTDLKAGLEVIRGVLQKGGIHRRSWILFHDEHLLEEWVGAYDDTPRPPMPAND